MSTDNTQAPKNVQVLIDIESITALMADRNDPYSKFALSVLGNVLKAAFYVDELVTPRYLIEVLNSPYEIKQLAGRVLEKTVNESDEIIELANNMMQLVDYPIGYFQQIMSDFYPFIYDLAEGSSEISFAPPKFQ